MAGCELTPMQKRILIDRASGFPHIPLRSIFLKKVFKKYKLPVVLKSVIPSLKRSITHYVAEAGFKLNANSHASAFQVLS